MITVQGVDPELAELLVQEDYHDDNDPVLIPSNYVTDLICYDSGIRVTCDNYII